MEFIRLETGEIGVATDYLYRHVYGRGYKPVKVLIEYQSKETGRYRRRWFDLDTVKYVSEDVYNKYSKAVHERAYARYLARYKNGGDKTDNQEEHSTMHNKRRKNA